MKVQQINGTETLPCSTSSDSALASFTSEFLEQLESYRVECQDVLHEVSEAVRHLSELRMRYVHVSTQTNALHEACETSLQEQVGTPLVHNWEEQVLLTALQTEWLNKELLLCLRAEIEYVNIFLDQNLLNMEQQATWRPKTLSSDNMHHANTTRVFPTALQHVGANML